jgi:hypothetical protein
VQVQRFLFSRTSTIVLFYVEPCKAQQGCENTAQKKLKKILFLFVQAAEEAQSPCSVLNLARHQKKRDTSRTQLLVREGALSILFLFLTKSKMMTQVRNENNL